MIYDYNLGTFDTETGRPFYPNPDELINPNSKKQEPLMLGTDFYNDLQINHTVKKTIEYFQKNPLKPFYELHDQLTVKAGTIADNTVFYDTKIQSDILRKGEVDVVAFEDISFLKTC